MIDKKVSAQQLLELKDIIDAYLTLGINMDMRYSDFLKEIKFPKTEMILKDVLTKLFNIIKKKNLNELFSFEAQILNLYHIFLNQEGTEVDNDDDERDRFLENTFSILELFECVLNKALDNSLYFFDIYQLYNLLFEFYNDYEVEIIKPEKVSSIFSKNNSKKSHKIIRNKDNSFSGIEWKSLIILLRFAIKPGVFRSSKRGDIKLSDKLKSFNGSTSLISLNRLYSLSSNLLD